MPTAVNWLWTLLLMSSDVENDIEIDSVCKWKYPLVKDTVISISCDTTCRLVCHKRISFFFHLHIAATG